MTTLRFPARSGGRSPLPLAATFFAVLALLAVAGAPACGGDDDDDSAKGYIGTNYPDPPRLGPPAGEGDAGAGVPPASR